MQYLLMCCFDENAWMKISDAQRDDVMLKYGEFHDELVSSGHYRGGGRLSSSSTATTIRQRNGKPIITDGPFAETKEQLGGYHVVDCRNLDEAISIATRIPTLGVGGSVEVRPLDPLPEPAADRTPKRI